MRHFNAAQIAALKTLRARFLDGTAGAQDYWRSEEELALYDATFAERIGWKWDAVIRELRRRGWTPRSRRALDWGCGSGVAGRRVLAAWPEFTRLALHDRSVLALRFAERAAAREFPQVQVERVKTVEPDSLLLVSHVANELNAPALESLLRLGARVREIIWVEAGTHADSRRLSEIRERLLPHGFSVIAPCTHQAPCGMLAPANERHWCHSFGAPPPEAFQDGRWAEFGRELGIDLRSLPYSFLALARDPAPPLAPGCSRVIGAPREAKGFLKVLSCQADGVCEFMLQKRDAPELHRELRKDVESPVYRWTMERGKITGSATTGVE